MTVELPPLSLYLHFPWCVRKCPYCDFNSHTLHGDLPETRYVDALLQDLALQAELVQGRALQTVFLGGGTPSLFSPASLSRLLTGVRSQCGLDPQAEITLEANPGTIERGRFADYRAVGINRVSLGAQSFDDAQLQRLGRIHASADTRRAVEELRAAQFTNFNLDLMYALPEQSIGEALRDLNCAISLAPAHLSHYQLTLEPGTVFAGRPPAGMPDNDVAADMQLACQERLAEAGFIQYEVSAYARQGWRCRHNLNYWEFGDYLGVGAGAHGKCTSIDGAALRIERTLRTREPRRYLAELGSERRPVDRRVVPASDLPFEYLLNALRMPDGFEQAAFESRTGLRFDTVVPAFAAAQDQGLLRRQAGRWSATPQGLNFLNDLQESFLPESVGQNATVVSESSVTASR
jgi:putative oxygen-independent coproporphyrinogen III oxidase